MRSKSFSSLALLIAAVLCACAPAATSRPAQDSVDAGPEAGREPLRIAVLPIIDTLPMYVARQEGLFEQNGVDVEFIPVGSAPERDQLIAAGQADGMVNETISTMLFNQEAVQVQVVRYALRPTAGAGHFFILASGQSGITDVQGLKNVEIGVSQGTVIEYVTERLLAAEGFTADEIKTVAVPKMPDRMALLASGELKAGVLPDPLGALAVQQNAVIVLDDSAHPEYGFSVISFRKAVIDAQPQTVRAFLTAIEAATTLLNQNPSKYTDVLSDNKLVPPALLETYRVPPFPPAGVPSEAEWNDALSWARAKGLLAVDVRYESSVNRSLLP